MTKAHRSVTVPDFAPPENGNGGLFYYPEEVTPAYEAAEFKLRQLINHGKVVLPVASNGSIRNVAREIADAVIRSVPDWSVSFGDITDLPGVEVETIDWGK